MFEPMLIHLQIPFFDPYAVLSGVPSGLLSVTGHLSPLLPFASEASEEGEMPTLSPEAPPPEPPPPPSSSAPPLATSAQVVYPANRKGRLVSVFIPFTHSCPSAPAPPHFPAPFSPLHQTPPHGFKTNYNQLLWVEKDTSINDEPREGEDGIEYSAQTL